MFGFSDVVARIFNAVVENGRVQGDGEGGFNPESVETEVEFEARERGYENSDEIGEAARDMVRQR